MKSRLQAVLLAGAAWSAAGTALAQEVPPDNAVEQIVVTARRTAESLQRVPGSVSAFSAAALERLDARDPTDLQGAVPNLNIVQSRGSSNATNIYIRGVGQPDALQTFDPAVGVYVDDVYYSRIRGTQFDLFDLERVEVLRGPQGTLYGKNTIGGALKFVTRKPSQDVRAVASGTLGSYGRIEAKAAISGPVSSTVAVGLAGLVSRRDGYVADPVLKREYNDKDTRAIRGALAFTPDERLRVDLSADWARDDDALTVGRPVNTLTTLYGTPLLVLPATPPEYDFKTRTSASLPNSTRLTHWGGSAAVGYQLADGLTLKSITAYRKLSSDDHVDIDATQLELADVSIGVDQDQTSQEFQLAWDDGGPLTAVGGVYWLKEHITSNQEIGADDLIGALFGNPTFRRTVDDDLEMESWAAYANASWQATEALRLSAGLRYTHERKDYFRTTSTFSSHPLFTSATPFAFQVDDTWEDVSPMASIDYRLTPDAMLYARYSRGFKSGGFNGRANFPGEQAPYDPETMNSYEVGVKTQWWDQRLRVNATAFRNDYKDFQARVSGLVVDPDTGVPTPELTVLNAGALEISGAELEIQAQVVRELLLEAEIGWLDARYEAFDDARFVAFGGSRAFQTPAFSPEWTMRFAGSYEWSFGDLGWLTVGGQARFRSEMALAVDNTRVNSNVRVPGLWQDDYWLFDARLVWQSADRRYSLGVYGRNLSDEVYKTDAQEFSSVGNIRTAYYGAPRTWSVTASARW